jgi:hypothetical protein
VWLPEKHYSLSFPTSILIVTLLDVPIALYRSYFGSVALRSLAEPAHPQFDILRHHPSPCSDQTARQKANKAAATLLQRGSGGQSFFRLHLLSSAADQNSIAGK